jgi:hypothetical protein
MAIDKGKENIEDENDRKAVDGIIHVLDTVLFHVGDSNDAAHEQDHELDEGLEQ